MRNAITKCALIFCAAGMLTRGVRAAEENDSPVRQGQKRYAEVSRQIAEETRMGLLLTPGHRDELRDKVVPLLKDRIEATKEKSGEKMTAAPRARIAMDLAEMAFLGDKDAGAELDAWQKKTHADADAAKCAELVKRWYEASEKPDEQAAVMDALTDVVKAKPNDPYAFEAAREMMNCSTTTAELQRRASELVSRMRISGAQHYGKMPNQTGKPLKIEGKTSRGSEFKSSDWDGKVVMICFWATWCPPCREEQPRVEKLYSKYHGKGLEIVGVSADLTLDKLQDFVKENHMPWPQLFVGGSTAHPIQKKFEISAIPATYILDKHGVLRSIYGVDQMEVLVPRLLNED